MIVNFWLEFSILFIATLIGSAAVLPYSLRLLPKDKPLRMSMSKLVLLSILQGAVIFAIVTGVGLVVAHSIGLGAPFIEMALIGSWSAQAHIPILSISIIFGVLAGIILLIGDLLFLPYWPEALVDTARKTTLLENFTASFYGGINEEILVRFFGLSVLVWLFSRVWHTSIGLPTNAVFWVANVLMAILFGIGHLPALKNLVGKISAVMLVRSLVLNAPIGLMCGWLFWTYGIEAAIVAHFSADIVYHVFGTIVLRRKLDART
jgi:hypothetical protein